jgi:tRNA A37 threonylcarbamoyladenosine modification protein TsaB
VVAASALEMLARIGAGEGAPRRVAAWMDAQRAQVFAALYEVVPREPPRLVQPAVARAPHDVLRAWEGEWRHTSVRFIGDGAVRYADLIRASMPDAEIAPVPLIAPEIARFAFAHAADAIPPHAIVPIYVRPPDAELARDRRSSA